MKDEEKGAGPVTGAPIEASLREQLEAIEREETPERLLDLARELQRLLRDQG
ncbi:hypothetical protein OB2597_19266 [Pseudooceanicola batsensis HTCC2597]|uniref:Uncharacterized protein n=1 Tax=Pseudooceanicola batsensis (strain ATCC BAA-863 / DSM 15984 / KCTC 12145 / HTCC2597) TaxID=252305 RepID=A3U0G3_PSEBH|nr:hypothetical protein [Pseudooceanicola batsensis]EAQ02254.1 hypothetical protein OB2597_19266 [Pseudooceanicola batsensis HTCC2597]